MAYKIAFYEDANHIHSFGQHHVIHIQMAFVIPDIKAKLLISLRKRYG